MPGTYLPEWASLVRLTTDELVLIAYYRTVPADQRESILEFSRVSAEAEKARRGENVIVLPPRNTAA